MVQTKRELNTINHNSKNKIYCDNLSPETYMFETNKFETNKNERKFYFEELTFETEKTFGLTEADLLEVVRDRFKLKRQANLKENNNIKEALRCVEEALYQLKLLENNN